MLGYRVISAGLLLILVISTPIYGRDWQAAREAYKKARQYHDQLCEIPESNQSIKRYNRAIFLYRTVIDHDPTYGACDDALYAIANLYEEMAKRFQRDHHRLRAIYYYEFVAEQYPLTKHKKAALEQASFLKRKSAARKEQASQQEAEEVEARKPDLATVSELRYWSSEDYTRVVIQLDREVEFQKHVLLKPARIYFDLEGTRLESDLQGRTYTLNDLYMRQIRVAENRAGVVRVVLDFAKINKHTVFALYDPFRIVIDIQGGKRRDEAARADAERTVKTEEAVISLKAEAGNKVKTGETPLVPAPNLGGDRSLTRVLGLKVGRVVIDPGHGGGDTGTIGPGGLKEKDLVLAVSLRLKELLEERLSTDVVVTRSTDKFVPLEERTAIANQLDADLFISIHANSSRNRKISGVETFFLNFASSPDEREVASRENAGSQKNIRDLENLLKQIALGDYNEESRDLAHTVQKSLYSEMKDHRRSFRNRGVKRAPFIVLINLNMPGILTEIGFLSNPSDETYFKNRPGQTQVAEALYQGIEEYFRSLGTVPFPGHRTFR